MMKMRELINVAWKPRLVPLPPCALACRNDAAYRLAAKLVSRDDGYLARLKGVGKPDLLVLLGHADDLPWTDGAHYFGIDPDAPYLLIPTHREPSVNIQIIEKAILKKRKKEHYILSPRYRCLIPTGAARTLDRASLNHWLKGIDG
jgi:hypothetical protein